MINPLKEVEVNRFVLRHPRVTEALADMCIAQITDIHLGRWVKPRHLLQIVEFVNEHEPHLVALTGDYVGYNTDDIAPCIQTLGELEPPTYAVLGNHDHWASTEQTQNEFERAEIPLLTNERVRFAHGDTEITVVGVDDHVTRHADVEAAFDGHEDEGFCLTLNHVPAVAPACAEKGSHLILSGHTHGFQFNVPGVTHKIAESFGTEYYAGPYRLGESYLYISRGLGSASWPWRIRAKPEITFFDLRPSKEIHLELVESETMSVKHRP
ncbi:metallophosphoesterase [Persicimonas caeni]|nr:metallophosphoesterase [Persicimonas caeni]